jgi:hypothetical protein
MRKTGKNRGNGEGGKGKEQGDWGSEKLCGRQREQNEVKS